MAGARETTDLHTEAKSLHGLGDVCRTTGEVDEAIDRYQQAVDVRRRIGDLLGLACSLFEGGKLLATVGRTDLAQTALAEAVVIFDNLQDATADEVRGHLAEHRGGGTDRPPGG
ncbi:tetratricopeptide repeat protein [Streptomyces sp. A5-4]|uniref:tetratricopeptide repeat protein n=1 Tax=Streptomyces sp. A5-4 TaxID=3384771 RepID=UPI003DA9DBA8